MSRFATSYFSKLTGIIFLILTGSYTTVSAQAKQPKVQPKPDSTETKYFAEIKTFSEPFVQNLRRNYVSMYSRPENTFIGKTDSLRKQMVGVLAKYSPALKPAFIKEQQIQISYYLDKLLADYPANYSNYTGHPVNGSILIPARLQKHFADLNDPTLINEVMFRNYAHSWFSFMMIGELAKPIYSNADNRSLQASINLINRLITNKKCRNFWQYDYLYNYITNNGIKNIDKAYRTFKAICTDTAYLHRVNSLYAYELKQRQGHVTRIYKTAGPYKLEMHLFLPDSASKGGKHPVMVYFHPGDWREGKPDWYFDDCKRYARKGWVACVVEYRTYDREGATAIDAVEDARSAIRWLREHAAEFNIDTGRIVANGYDAGGQLALACAFADKYNEKSDDLQVSPAPNLIMVTSGLYDLTGNNNAWMRGIVGNTKLLRDISPLYQVKTHMPPVLVIHGRKDENEDYTIAHHFGTEMHNSGNVIAFHPIDGAGHLLWLDNKYAGEVEKVQQDFLKKYGYDR